MKVYEITDHNFRQEVLESPIPVLLDFWAPWCGPCNMLSPVLEGVAAEHANIKVCKINVDTQRELASQYKVYRIPTLVVMKQGQEKNRVTGVRTGEELAALFV